MSSKSVSWRGGAGGLMNLCIKRSYSEPTRAESREGSSTLAESSRVTWCPILIGWRLRCRNARFWLADNSGYVILDSDWLTKLKGSRFWLAADHFSVLGTSRVCSAMYKGRERANFRHNFRHCEIFSKKFKKFLAGPPARIIITPADNY